MDSYLTYGTMITNYNKESLYKALDRQWGGVDDVNSIMWLLK